MKGKRSPLAGAALSLLSVLLVTTVSYADSTVVPGFLQNVEGNFGNSLPFHLTVAVPASARYQQVYSSSEFAALGPIVITRIGFRPNAIDGSGSGVGSAFLTTIPSIQINLSTTSAGPGALSTIFAANVGSDDTVVHRGSLLLSSAFTGPATGPKAFDISIPLTTPFLYDATKGNLLLDVRNFSNSETAFFDASFLPGDSVSRVSTNRAGNADSPVADFADTLGLVTQFEWVPLTPRVAIGLLINDIQTLLNDAILTQDQVDGLRDKLEAAIASLTGRNSGPACNQIHAFVNQVNAFIKAGIITIAQGQALTDAANDVSGMIGCP